MSSCAVSCGTCFHEASYASATSASLPTGSAPYCCRSASACSRERPIYQPRDLKSPDHSRFRRARTAVERCNSSNGSHRPNCWLDLHSAYKSVQHGDVRTPASLSTRAFGSHPSHRGRIDPDSLPDPKAFNSLSRIGVEGHRACG
jgi:hypothetical protein